MYTLLRGPNNLFILHQIIIEPDFSCLADEMAEPRPDMNIKVAAFTVSEKSINIQKNRHNEMDEKKYLQFQLRFFLTV